MSEANSDRYAKQTLFQLIGPEGQERIPEGTAAVIGLGGLGTVIANNLCRDRARRRGVERRGRDRMEDIARSAPPPSPAAHPDLRLEMRQRLAELPDRLREVLVLRYYHELPEREIAEIVGVPRGTVKSRLHAAVKTLRARGETEDDG